ncbi:MAG: hypothetical protein C4320_07165 [Armatimonadota bacterium]
MKPLILASPREIRRYRLLKVIVPVLLATTAVTLRAIPSPHPDPKASSGPKPHAATNTLREDWPLRLPVPAGSPSELPLGTYKIFGKGPIGTQAQLCEGEYEVTTFPTEPDGAWQLRVKVLSPGVMNFRVHYYSGKAVAGRSVSLPIRFASPDAKLVPEVRITNVTPHRRVPAGELVLKGAATPGDSVRVRANHVHLGRTQVDLDGTWSLAVPLSSHGPTQLIVEDEITGRTSLPLPIVVGQAP